MVFGSSCADHHIRPFLQSIDCRRADNMSDKQQEAGVERHHGAWIVIDVEAIEPGFRISGEPAKCHKYPRAAKRGSVQIVHDEFTSNFTNSTSPQAHR